MKKIINQDYQINFHNHNVLEIIFDPKNDDINDRSLNIKNVPRINSSILKQLENHIYDEQFVIFLNFENVNYIDSAGIGAIVEGQRKLSRHNKCDTKIKVTNSNRTLLKIFNMLGLEGKIIEIY